MTECNKENRFTCDWIFNQLVVLSDGKVVCGCADPYGERPLGHLDQQSLYDIWTGEKVKEIRRGLNQGHACFCHPCGLKLPLKDNEPIPQAPEHLEILPRIYLEPTVLCNLSCFKAVCHPKSGILESRASKSMSLDQFKAILDEVGPKLVRLDLFNYGDPFVHPRAVDKIEYIKEKYPHIYLYISTNGLMLDEEKIKRIIRAGLDEITFSVDGPDQETYQRYRQGGDFEKVKSIMSTFVRERELSGRELPFINWRYILFKWNSSKAHMNKTRKLAKKIGGSGVDRLTWEITDHPPEARSEKYQPGTVAWKKIYHEIWDSSQIGNAIRSKRFIAQIKVKENTITMKSGAEDRQVRVRVKNIGGALWPKATLSGRRLVRLGAQLHDHEKKLLDLNYARAFLNSDIANKQKDIITICLPSPPAPGEYLLKFDMVSEGNDWFENGGSPVVWAPFHII